MSTTCWRIDVRQPNKKTLRERIGDPGGTTARELRVWFKNENHVSWLDGQPWICSPDLLSIVDNVAGRGITSTAISEGDEGSAVGMRGLDVFRTDHALEHAFGPKYFGLDEVAYVPIEDLV